MVSGLWQGVGGGVWYVPMLFVEIVRVDRRELVRVHADGEGRWSEVGGRRSAVAGRWSVVGGRRTVVGGRRTVVGGRRAVVGGQ